MLQRKSKTLLVVVVVTHKSLSETRGSCCLHIEFYFVLLYNELQQGGIMRILITWCLLASVVCAEPIVVMPGGGTIKNGKAWRQQETANFQIFSLKEEQGRAVASSVEEIKLWTMIRWGIETKNRPLVFSKKYRIIVVPDQSSLKDLFQLEQAYAETGTTSACWVVFDSNITCSLCVFLTEFCLNEYEQQNHIVIAYWARRGMSILNGDPERIRKLLSPVASYVAADRKMFFSESLFTISKDSLLQSTSDNISLYDKEVALLCLMLRKEFGQRRFMMMIADSSAESLFAATGYESYSKFDLALKRYLYYASNDMARGRMPDSYLSGTP